MIYFQVKHPMFLLLNKIFFFLTTNLCLYLLFDLISHVLVSVIYLLHNQIFLIEMKKRLEKTET